MVVVALGNMSNPRAVDVLLNLLNDDEVAGYAIIALGKLKEEEFKKSIEPFLDHPKPGYGKRLNERCLKLTKPDRTIDNNSRK